MKCIAKRPRPHRAPALSRSPTRTASRSAISPVEPLLSFQRAVGNRTARKVVRSRGSAPPIGILRAGNPVHYEIGRARAWLRPDPERRPRRQAAPAPLAQTEWQSSATLRTRYGNWQAYQAVRNRVSGWSVPAVTHVRAYIEGAIREWGHNKGIHGDFGNNFDGNPHRSYLNLRRLYRQRGITDPASHIAHNIVRIRFYNRRTRGHRQLRTALQNAQTNLTAAGYTVTLQRGTWAFVPRTFNDNINRLSNHALGRAIDINPRVNPHIKSRDEIRVIDAVCRPILPHGLLAESNPVLLRLASVYFQNRFNSAWVSRQTALRNDLRTAHRGMRQQTWRWRRRIRTLRRQVSRLRRTLRHTRDTATRERLTATIQRKEHSIVVYTQAVRLLRPALRVTRLLSHDQSRLVGAIRRRRRALNPYAARGFFNQPLILTLGLQAAGLQWGGEWHTAKDFMHFELP